MKRLFLLFIAFSSGVSAQTLGACAYTLPVLVHTWQATPCTVPTGASVTVTAAKADDYVDSIGVNSHYLGGYSGTSYRNADAAMNEWMLASHIRHFRDGTGTRMDVARRLANNRIRFDMSVEAAPDGVVNDISFWCNGNNWGSTTLDGKRTTNLKSGPFHCMTYQNFFNNWMGPGIVEATEGWNEPYTSSFSAVYWHATDTVFISNVIIPGQPLYWAQYLTAIQDNLCAFAATSPNITTHACVAPSLLSNTNYFYPQGWWKTDHPITYANVHPYPYGGNTHTGTNINYVGSNSYINNTTNPVIANDEYPFSMCAQNTCAQYAPSFTSNVTSAGAYLPYRATEFGWSMGTTGGNSFVTQTQHSMLYSTAYPEFFRHGWNRAYSYEFADEGGTGSNEGSYGMMMASNVGGTVITPKPTFFAIQSEIALLEEPGQPSWSPGTLTYSVAATANGAQNKLQYVHDLLLEKSNHTFYLLMWQGVSPAQQKNNDGTMNTVDVNTAWLPLTTTVTLPGSITKATLYSYDTNWRLQPSPLPIVSSKITLSLAPQLQIVQLN